MPDDTVTPYVEVKPGDLITADIFNTVQEDVKKDITQQIKTSIGGITTVKHADDAGTISGLNVDQLTSQILEKVKAMIPGRTGYKRVFKLLKPGQPNQIKHNLGAEPVVDVYQLDFFQVVCAQGETAADAVVEYVNFYLYHESERQVRGTLAGPANTGAGASTVTVTIDDLSGPTARVALKDLLTEFGVDTSKDGTTLDEIVTALWTAMFGPQFGNDQFYAEQYCHSPWMEKCCGELRTIKQLRDRGDWDHLWVKMFPRKTINYPATLVTVANKPEADPLTLNGAAVPVTSPPVAVFPSPAPTQIEVVHLDLNTAAIGLVADPVPPPNAPAVMKNQLAVMVILKA